jgi:uncharacterized membrane protein
MASTMAVPRRSPGGPAANAATVTNPAAARDQRYQKVQVILFVVGAALMPLGIVAIFVAWYGVAHSHYEYDQLTYIVSGGVLGVGLILLGGFLYFGAWLARMATDQRESARRLSDALLVLADAASRAPAQAGGGSAAAADAGAVPVLAGGGSTVHRRDCALIAHRDDLRALTGTETGLGTCRVCRPEWG